MSSLDDLSSDFRKQFPICGKKVFLASCSQGALSTAVADAVREYLEDWDRLGSPWDLWVEKLEQARALLARLIGAKKEEVAITFSVSSAVNSLASAVSYGRRDKVLLGEFEFPTMAHVWLAQRSHGARIEYVMAQGEEIGADSYASAIDESTLIVPLTYVCYKNGFKFDVPSITRSAHQRGALVLLDAYQCLGALPANVRELDVDFLVGGCLKYLLGPSGVAFLYVRESLIESLEPTASGWFAQENPFAYDVHNLDYARSARRFETGTPPIPNLYGAIAALQLLLEVGLDRVEEHVTKLSAALVEGAVERGFTLKTPLDPARRGPLVVIKARDVQELLKRLADDGIIASSRADGLRISLHFYNNAEDVQAVLDALQKNRSLLA